jgi:hypothetical protein
MTKRILFCALLMLMSCFGASAQQSSGATPQPLTFWYEYHVNPGKEDEFLNLVKTVGGPVRDKLMADGVIQAWGVDKPIIRVAENATHMIWYMVADYAGVEKGRERFGGRQEGRIGCWRPDRASIGDHRLCQDARLPDAGDRFGLHE